jgi:hypothetical protein
VDTGRVIIPPGYKTQMDEAAKREAIHEKIRIVGIVTLVWFSICIVILMIGYGVAWVVRGFRKV